MSLRLSSTLSVLLLSVAVMALMPGCNPDDGVDNIKTKQMCEDGSFAKNPQTGQDIECGVQDSDAQCIANAQTYCAASLETDNNDDFGARNFSFGAGNISNTIQMRDKRDFNNMNAQFKSPNLRVQAGSSAASIGLKNKDAGIKGPDAKSGPLNSAHANALATLPGTGGLNGGTINVLGGGDSGGAVGGEMDHTGTFGVSASGKDGVGRGAINGGVHAPEPEFFGNGGSGVVNRGPAASAGYGFEGSAGAAALTEGGSMDMDGYFGKAGKLSLFEVVSRRYGIWSWELENDAGAPKGSSK